MSFCQVCKYIYNIQPKKGKDNQYIYKCSKCNNEKEINNLEVISKMKLTSEGVITNTNLLKNDDTLLRTKNYNCPNKDCSTYKDKNKKEAIQYKVSQNSLQIAYHCVVCGETWYHSEYS